jgi:hypothetical protein
VFNINQFQSTLANAKAKKDWSEDILHPNLQAFIADLRSKGVAVVVAEGNKKQDGTPSRNQCLLNNVFLGYYKGSWGEHPWQVGPKRDCCAREVALELFAGKDVNESSFSKTARDFAEVEEMKESKAKAVEAPKAVAAPIAAIQAPVVALDVTAITVAALQAGKTTDEVLAIIAALKA